jgi:hypothetical protein
MMWAQVINVLLGIWLMASPAFFDFEGTGRTNDLIIGPMAAGFALIALWEVTRAVGKVNVGLGTWLVIAPWILGYGSLVPAINDFVIGIMLSGLAMTRIRTRATFGGGWSSLWRTVTN